METEGNAQSQQREGLADRASEELRQVEMDLRQARKLLARDWESLTPRERSAHSRRVKALEEQERALAETIEMNRLR
jgi:hypothetical protein